MVPRGNPQILYPHRDLHLTQLPSDHLLNVAITRDSLPLAQGFRIVILKGTYHVMILTPSVNDVKRYYMALVRV
jgi:hypothetical protein